MKRLIGRLLKVFKLLVRKFYGVLNKADQKVGGGFDKKAHDFFVRRTAGAYDMYAESDESYYADQYGRFIRRELERRKLGKGSVLLDLACGQGRIISKLQSYSELEFKKIIGVDGSSDAINRAHDYLATSEPDKSSVELVKSDITEYLEDRPDGSVDVILLIEVLYMLPDYEQVLSMIARKLRPRGVVFVSLRSEYYYALTVLRHGLFASVPMVIERDRGSIFGTDVEMNWTRSEYIFNEFSERYGLRVEDLFGIGACSGIANDPHDIICRPSELSKMEIKQLQAAEDHFGKLFPDTGRYMLFIASST